ncbi:MAG: hypothetical protein RLY31_1867 [Bacteroidota bacterium]
MQTGVSIHYLTKRAYRPLLEGNPYIDRVHIIDKRVTECLSVLRQERYDYVIDLHGSLRSWQLKCLLPARFLHFPKSNFAKWRLVHGIGERSPVRHVVDRYFEAAGALGVRYDGQGLDYFLPTGCKLPVLPFPVGTPYLAFVIGAAHATKRIPPHKVVDICKVLTVPVILLGGRAEAADGERIALSAGRHVHNLCGKVDLHGSAMVIRDARKVICPDTGMMHVAAAFGKEILSVWGSTSPAFGMWPYLPEGKADGGRRFEVAGLPCRPCSRIGYPQCPKGHFKCMEDQSVREIADWAARTLPTG